MSSGLERVKQWFRRAKGSTESAIEGGEPATTSPPGADTEYETSTNAQTEGAVGEPWPEEP